MSRKGGADPGAFQSVDCSVSTSPVSHNAFRSASARLLPDPPDWALFPAPCDYDPLHKANYRSQLLLGKTDTVCFNTSANRFQETRDNGVPGPGGYDPRLKPQGRGVAVSSEPYRIQ